MTLKICHEWNDIEYIEATCPYCHIIDTYFGTFAVEGSTVICQNRKCRKKFRLGEQE